MGKGDKKTRRGKIIRGSYGVRRRRKDNPAEELPKQIVKPAAVKAEVEPKAKPAKPVPKKTPAAKPAAEKKAPVSKTAAEKKPTAKPKKKAAPKKE
jgi:30S ribosomal protein S31